MESMTRLIDIKEASEVLGVTIGTLYQWVHYRRLPHYKVGRLVKFRPADLDTFIESRRVEPLKWESS